MSSVKNVRRRSALAGGASKKGKREVSFRAGNKEVTFKARKPGKLPRQLKPWVDSVAEAKENLGLDPEKFHKIKKGNRLHKEATKIHKKKKSGKKSK